MRLLAKINPEKKLGVELDSAFPCCLLPLPKGVE
jgi:hypothetical protein